MLLWRDIINNSLPFHHVELRDKAVCKTLKITNHFNRSSYVNVSENLITTCENAYCNGWPACFMYGAPPHPLIFNHLLSVLLSSIYPSRKTYHDKEGRERER